MSCIWLLLSGRGKVTLETLTAVFKGSFSLLCGLNRFHLFLSGFVAKYLCIHRDSFGCIYFGIFVMAKTRFALFCHRIIFFCCDRDLFGSILSQNICSDRALFGFVL